VELLTAAEEPLPDYSGRNAAIIRQSGFQVPVAWNGSQELRGLPERVRLHVVFEGKRNTDIRLSALDLQPNSESRSSPP
jgi:hypothetical protein